MGTSRLRTHPMENISLKSPAKINTSLRIMDKRPNGYHELQMTMVKLSLSDAMTLSSLSSSIELVCDNISDEGMKGERNLAWRAAAAFQRAMKIKRGVRIQIEKNIPTAAGLGGGSSNAAAVLKGLNQLWETNLSEKQLADIGITLGADIPFFCYDGAACVEGIGERVTPLATFPKLFLCLVHPPIAISTRWAYETYDRRIKKTSTTPPHGQRDYQTVDDVLETLSNDLETVVLETHPEIGEIKSRLKEYGARGALMTGSGSTVFGIFQDKAARDKAASRISGNSWKIFAAESA